MYAYCGLALNFETKNDGTCISLHHVHRACEDFFIQNAEISAPNTDVLSKLMMRLFEAQTQQIFQDGERKLIFPNLGPRPQRSQCEANLTLSSMCILMQTAPVFTFQCPVDAVQWCTAILYVGCETQDTWLKFMNVKLSAGFPIQISLASINGLIHLVAALSLSKGVLKDESYFPPSFMEETLSNSFSANRTIIMRSKTCKQIVDWQAKKSICKTCSDSIYVRKKREKKHKLSDLHGEDENKENKKVCKAPT